MHSLFRGLFVVGFLEKDSYFGIWKTEMAIDVATYVGQRFLDSVERCGPERYALIKIRDVDHKVANTAAMHLLRASPSRLGLEPHAGPRPQSGLWHPIR